MASPLPANPPFVLDFRPEVGVATPLTTGLQRVVAPNPSPMTFTGTNTYLLGERSLAVIDPGPDDDRHLAALRRAIAGRPVTHVLVTHSHVDHSPLARRLARETGAPVLALGDSGAGRSEAMTRLAARFDLGGGEGVDRDFIPDQRLTDGQVVVGEGWSLRAIATPGHFGNHLCFDWVEEGVLFSGDHVMSWATTLVSPPDGDLTAFMASLDRLARGRQHRLYWPGHGAAVEDPAEMLAHLIRHRRGREAQILSRLEGAAATPRDLTMAIYDDVDPRLIPAAERNVLAHLIDLSERGVVAPDGELSPGAVFRLK